MPELDPEVIIPETAPPRSLSTSRLATGRPLRNTKATVSPIVISSPSSLSSSRLSSPSLTLDDRGTSSDVQILGEFGSSPPRAKTFAGRLKAFACSTGWAGKKSLAAGNRNALPVLTPTSSDPDPISTRTKRQAPQLKDLENDDDCDRAENMSENAAPVQPSTPQAPPKKKRRLVALSEIKSRKESAGALEGDDSSESAKATQLMEDQGAVGRLREIFVDVGSQELRKALWDADGSVETAAEIIAATNERSVTPSSRRSFASPSADSSPAVLSRSASVLDVTDEWQPSVNSHSRRSSSEEGNEEGETLAMSTVKFFSEATAEELMEFTGCGLEQANKIISMRPFGVGDADYGPNYSDRVGWLRKAFRRCRTKGVTPKLIETYLDMRDAYREVDNLIRKCEKIGVDISQALKSWVEGGLAGNDDGGEGGLHITSIAAASSLQTADGFQPITEQPLLVTMPLKGYQLVGVNWLAFLHHRRLSGILADEMGLGKTCQVISFLANLFSNGHEGPHLVIVPSSTLENWLREFDKFAPSVPVRAYYGNQRDELRADLESDPNSYYVLITTYTIAVGKGDRKFLRHRKFKSMVLDEGHLVKNMASSRYKELMRIKAPFRLLLTGTPLQNNIQELMSLLSFVMPSLFVSEKTQETLATLFKLKSAATTGSEASLLSKHRIDRAKRMMTPFVLRRRKDMVLKDLPPKSQSVKVVPMTPRQQALYDAAVKAQAPGLMATDEDSNLSKINNVLAHFRKVADHPLLLRELYTDEKLHVMSKQIMKEELYWDANPTYIFEDMQVMSDFELHRLCRKFKSIKSYALSNNEWMDAGKVRHLSKMLPVMIDNGDRILIFSIYTSVLDILEEVMTTLKIRYLRVDGQTKVDERQSTIDRFNDDLEIPVFLLSTKAGGVGLNLNAANVVIIYNLDFNPQNDKQAEDRAHRVGQKREVRVYRLVSKDTIDEQILGLANAKLKLDKSINHAEADFLDMGNEMAAASGILASLRASWSGKL